MIHDTPPENFQPKMRVSGCFVEVDGNILLVHRQPWKPDGNTWSLPAGKHEPGESPLAAIVRELKEETGIDLSDRPPELQWSSFVRLSAFDIEYFVFRVSLPSRPNITLEPDAHSEHTWMSPTDALKLSLIEDEDLCIKKQYSL